MLDPKIPFETRENHLVPAHIVVTPLDTDGMGVVLELPSAEEVRELKSNLATHISIKRITEQAIERQFPFYTNELNLLLRKQERFEKSVTFQTRIAELSVLSGDPAKGLEIAKALSDRFSAPEDRHRYGAFLVEANRIKEATEVFLTCNLNEDVMANLRLAQLALLGQDIPRAEGYIKQALEIDPLDYRTRMFNGTLHVWHGRWENAVRDFRVALEETDTPPSSLYVNLAAAYWGMGNNEKSIQTLKRAIAISPINESAVLFMTDALRIQGRQQEAIPALEHIVEYEKGNEKLWNRLGYVALEAGKANGNDQSLLDKARLAFRHQLKLNDSPQVWNDLGVVEYHANKKDKAKKYFTQSMKQLDDAKLDYTLPLSNLLSLMIESKLYSVVHQITKAYLDERKPDRSKLYTKILLQHAASLDARGQRDEGIKHLVDALDFGIDDLEARVEALNHIVIHYSFVKAESKWTDVYALELWEEIEKGKAHLPELVVSRSINNIVFSYLEIRNLAAAEALLPKLSPAIGNDPYATATLGLYHLVKRGDIDRAEALYRRAVSMVPDKTMKNRIRQRMHFEIAKHFEAKGLLEEARERFEKVLKISNGFDFVNTEANVRMSQLRLPKL